MSHFPTLKTGAVQQYPAQKSIQFATEIVRFLDGSEQRFRSYESALRRWVIRLELLDEIELHALREFFRNLEGSSGSFSFTDPWDGASHANCSFELDELTEELSDEGRGSTALTVSENRE
jgi:hypothetical protein